MITLTATINLSKISDEENSINLSGVTGNNISADINAVVGSESKGGNPFILDASPLDGTAFFADNKVDYFIGNMSCGNGTPFDEPYKIIFTSTQPITALRIVFDTYNNRFPRYLSINGTGYDLTSPIFEQVGLTLPSTFTIRIAGGYPANYPLVIQSISTEVNIKLNKKNLIHINRKIADRGDMKMPEWGIISNRGNIEFNDFDDSIKRYAESQLLDSGLKVEMFLNNTLTKKTEKVAEFNTDKWNYGNNDKAVSVTIKDDLEEWQKINIQGIEYDPRKPEHKTFADLYNYLYSKTPSKYSLLKLSDLDTLTQNVLKNTYIKYPLLENGTLWRAWEKMCKTLQLHIFKNVDGTTVCRYNGGN